MLRPNADTTREERVDYVVPFRKHHMPLRRVFGGKKPKPTRTIGRRGAILMTMGTAWILIGLGSLTGGNRIPGTGNLIHVLLLPAPVEGGLWVLSGILAVIFANRTDDEYGFLALYIMPAVRALSYFLGWVDYLSPVATAGYPRGWLSSLFYVVMILFIVICAGWPEPPHYPDDVLDSEGSKKEGPRS